MFALLNSALLERLPYPEPERLMQVWATDRQQGALEVGVSFEEYRRIADRTKSLEQVAYHSSWFPTDRPDRAGLDERSRLASGSVAAPGELQGPQRRPLAVRLRGRVLHDRIRQRRPAPVRRKPRPAHRLCGPGRSRRPPEDPSGSPLRRGRLGGGRRNARGRAALRAPRRSIQEPGSIQRAGAPRRDDQPTGPGLHARAGSGGGARCRLALRLAPDDRRHRHGDPRRRRTGGDEADRDSLDPRLCRDRRPHPAHLQRGGVDPRDVEGHSRRPGLRAARRLFRQDVHSGRAERFDTRGSPPGLRPGRRELAPSTGDTGDRHRGRASRRQLYDGGDPDRGSGRLPQGTGRGSERRLLPRSRHPDRRGPGLRFGERTRGESRGGQRSVRPPVLARCLTLGPAVQGRVGRSPRADHHRGGREERQPISPGRSCEPGGLHPVLSAGRGVWDPPGGNGPRWLGGARSRLSSGMSRGGSPCRTWWLSNPASGIKTGGPSYGRSCWGSSRLWR